MKTLLVALDASPVAEHVLAAARALATAMDAKVVLLRVVGLPTELPPEAFAMAPDNVATLLEEAARKDMTVVAREMPPGMLADSVVTIGTPWRTICDVADERGADVIVIGAHGHRFVDKILGTTTSRVVSHTNRSVYIVRPSAAPVPKAD